MLSKELIYELKVAIEVQLSKVALNNKEFLTFGECLQYTGLSANFIRQQVREGLPSYKLGGKKVFFRRQEVDDWVVSNRVAQGDDDES